MDNKNYIPTPLYDRADNHGAQLNRTSSQIPHTNDWNARHRESELGGYSHLSRSGPSSSQQLPISSQKSSSESAQVYAAPYEVFVNKSDTARSAPKVSTGVCQQQSAWCNTAEKVSLFALVILILLLLVSILVMLSLKYSSDCLTSTCDNCAAKNNEILLAVNQLSALQYFSLHPASCRDINHILPNSPSGYYDVNNDESIYCNMGELCGEKGGWTRLGYLNMSDPTQDCPSDFEEMTNDTIRACRRNEISSGCSSVTLSTNDIPYTQICGRVIGYQVGKTDALHNSREGIDSEYLDGVSITRGYEPREHVWSFIAGQTSSESSNYQSNCPCNNGSTVQVPDFIEEYYYCESGNNLTQADDSTFYPDPLWDGKECPSFESPCCTSKDLPWFHRVYNSSSIDIELRVCRNGHQIGEDIFIEMYEIYVI